MCWGIMIPQDRLLKIHSHLSADPVELRGNLLIALGESLLGRYIESRRWIAQQAGGPWGWRSYEIRLRPPRERDCLLSPAQLHAYLRLARMVPDPGHEGIYRITLNNNDGFIPPGLLFGLMYAWYLDNTCAPIMENEMSMLHWHEATLIPHQVKEYRRKKALIRFFQERNFRLCRAAQRLTQTMAAQAGSGIYRSAADARCRTAFHIYYQHGGTMGTLFGTDGIRGEANRHPMDAFMAFAVGQAVTHVLKKKGTQRG